MHLHFGHCFCASKVERRLAKLGVHETTNNNNNNNNTSSSNNNSNSNSNSNSNNTNTNSNSNSVLRFIDCGVSVLLGVSSRYVGLLGLPFPQQQQ